MLLIFSTSFSGNAFSHFLFLNVLQATFPYLIHYHPLDADSSQSSVSNTSVFPGYCSCILTGLIFCKNVKNIINTLLYLTRKQKTWGKPRIGVK